MATVTMYFPGNKYPDGYNPAIPCFDYNSSLGELLDLANSTLTAATATSVTLALQNGLVAKLMGTGFTYDSSTGDITGGTLTQIQLLLHDGTTKQQVVSGLSVHLDDF